MRMGQKMKQVCKSVLSVMLSVVMLMTVILVSQPKEVQAAQAGKSRAIYAGRNNRVYRQSACRNDRSCRSDSGTG